MAGLRFLIILFLILSNKNFCYALEHDFHITEEDREFIIKAAARYYKYRAGGTYQFKMDFDYYMMLIDLRANADRISKCVPNEFRKWISFLDKRFHYFCNIKRGFIIVPEIKIGGQVLVEEVKLNVDQLPSYFLTNK